MLTAVLRRSLPLYKRCYNTASAAATATATTVETVEDEVKLIEYQRDNLDIVKQCRQDPLLHEKTAYSHLSKSAREHSLLCTSLRGPGLIAVPPLLFHNQPVTKLLTIMHLGKNLCGHDGVIHGGLAASILDEAFAGVSFPSLPNKVGFTAYLNINYKQPIFSNQWVVVRSNLDDVQDRKAYLSATLESLNGDVFVEATSLFISPKMKINKKI